MSKTTTTEETRLAGNLAVSGSALIAEFMGDDFFVKLGFTYPKPMFVEGRILPEHCKFEKSWDWLMPVIEKIEIDCKYDVHIYGHYNWKEPNRCSIIDWRNNTIVGTDNDSKIKCVFDAVVEFVNWWNAKQADR